MVEWKTNKRTNNDLQNTTQNIKDRVTTALHQPWDKHVDGTQ